MAHFPPEEYKRFRRLSDILSRTCLSSKVTVSPDGCWIRYYIADNNNPEPLFEISREANSEGVHTFRFCIPYNDGYTEIKERNIVRA